MEEYRWAMLLGLTLGFLARVLMLRTDYRQYPTYPHGRIIHLALGFIAAALGAVAVPAFSEKDFTAVTFLALAAQQFRDVRNMEKDTLGKIDELELVPRGTAYIEGIAMVFEGRNYLVILTALSVSLLTFLLNIWCGLVIGLAMMGINRIFMGGKQLSHIVTVEEAPVRFEGPVLYVGDIIIMNVGLQMSRELILKRGLGLILTPKTADAKVTIANLGQRQAILHDASTILGVYRDSGTPSFMPLAKLDLESGRLGVFLLPHDKNVEKAMELVKRVPILESAIRKPTESIVNAKSKNSAGDL